MPGRFLEIPVFLGVVLYAAPCIASLDTLGSLVFELCSGQTNKQTDKQTNSKILPTPTDIVGVCNYGTKENNAVLRRAYSDGSDQGIGCRWRRIGNSTRIL